MLLSTRKYFSQEMRLHSQATNPAIDLFSVYLSKRLLFRLFLRFLVFCTAGIAILCPLISFVNQLNGSFKEYSGQSPTL